MQTEFTRSFMEKNCGCYSIDELNSCSFMKSDVITLESILTSEINIRDKYWFVCRKLASKEQNQQIAIGIAEIVLPMYEKIYPDDPIPRETIEGAKLFIAGHISLDELTKRRRAAYASSYAAYAASSYAADASAAAAAADAAAAAAYASSYAADASAAAAADTAADASAAAAAAAYASSYAADASAAAAAADAAAYAAYADADADAAASAYAAYAADAALQNFLLEFTKSFSKQQAA